MTKKPPPVPPAGRSTKDPSREKSPPTEQTEQSRHSDQGDRAGQATIEQNTTKGYQQDR